MMYDKYLWYSKLNGNVQRLSCFGCFIDPSDEWVRYVNYMSLFDYEGHRVW